MDSLFDHKGAGAVVEKLFMDQDDGHSLADINVATDWQSRFKVVQRPRPLAWCLVYSDTDDMEVTFTIHGTVTGKSLPPISVRSNIDPDKLRFLRQSITLSGYDSTCFQQARTAIDLLATFLKGSCNEPGHLKVPETVFAGKYPAIELANRYFTPARDSDGSDVIEIPKEYDPKGVLAGMIGQDPVFTMDNVVEYNECELGDGGTYRYKPLWPSRIQIGDVVTAQCTFMLVPIKPDGLFRFRLLPVLRAVTLVDIQFTQNLIKTYAMERTSMPKLKRTLSYSAGPSGKKQKGAEGGNDMAAEFEDKMVISKE